MKLTLDGNQLVALDGNQISDLFFNFEKPNLDAAYQNEASASELSEALRLDAQSFADMTGVNVEWVISDYQKRV
jgi:hypothetical protein